LIRQWYDGYSWDGETKVYNPYSLLSFFNQLEFSDFWRQTGTPTFLKQHNDSQPRVFDLSDNLTPIRDESIKINEIAKLDTVSLMVQTGYLTVKGWVRGLFMTAFNLGLPNLEIKASLIPLTLSIDRPNNLLSAKKLSVQMMEALFKRDAAGVEEAFSGYLTQHNFDSHSSKKYCRTLLLSALLMADQCAQPEKYGAEWDGVAHLKSPDSDDCIIELKYLPVQEVSKAEAPKTKANPQKRTVTQSDVTPASPKQQPEQEKTEQEKTDKEKPDQKKLENDKHRLKMAKLADKSIALLHRQYHRFRLVRSPPVFKAVLVVSGRADVLVKFEEDAYR
jgi:hypothetical protein